MKPCLKLGHSISPSAQRCPHPRKCVAFCAEGSEEVHLADEWDRTPAEPARSLSYQELLELKEIQRSLPIAHQIPDPLSRNPQSQLLCGVPVKLLPLLPDVHESSTAPSSFPPSSPPSSPEVSRSPVAPMSLVMPKPLYPPPAPIYHPPSLAHLPTAPPTPRRQRPSFTILPLLNTPPATPSSSQPPSARNSPPMNPRTAPYSERNQEPSIPPFPNVSLHSMVSSDHTQFQLPPPKYPISSNNNKTSSDVTQAQRPAKVQILPSMGLLSPSPLTLSTTTPAIEAMAAKKPNQSFNSVIRGKFVRKHPPMGATLDEREPEGAFGMSLSSTQALFPSPPPSPVWNPPLPITRSSPNLTQRME